jgi:hypothetical protein
MNGHHDGDHHRSALGTLTTASQVPNQSVGRVMEATISDFMCVCHELDCAPPLGALVLVLDGDDDIFAIVSDVRTVPQDPGRSPAPRGGPTDDRLSVLAQNPHIPALLHTIFRALVVGHEGPHEIARHLPDAPARIYSRVRVCDSTEMARFFERFDAFKLLLGAGPLADEVVGACLRRASATQPNPRAFLVRAGRALAVELATEPERLTAILSRVR